MLLELEERLRQAVGEFLSRHWQVQLSAIAVERPPRAELGDLALPLCFELARTLRKAPRTLAQEFQAAFPLPADFARLEVAGAGYLNFFARREAFWAALAAGRRDGGLRPRLGGKAIVEHTNINPNKAAHIGHLRNAALGDTFVRLLKYRGETVEVQNYIDNTGVQVADVAAGFAHLLGREAAAVRAEIAAWDEERRRREQSGAISPAPQNLPLANEVERKDYSFDYRCWDLYARISRQYEEQPESQAWRGEALAAIEHGGTPLAEVAAAVSDAIVGCHLRTMRRLNVGYDLLPRESEILHLHFWQAAFERLKSSGAIRLENAGKNAGCWVMDGGLGENGDAEREESKVIVRSNGTVTYVGKDIAYQLWKFGKLGRNFHYRRWGAAPRDPWVTTAEPSAADAPDFGRAHWVFNVIDTRQSYLQEIVAAGLRALGEREAAERSVHFSYEMVALTPRCAEQLGYELDAEARQRSHVEVSGRKGLGIKADDLIDQLVHNAWREVRARHPDRNDAAQLALAEPIAIGALRYFLLKFTKNALIAFDLEEALSFEGETGPYVQYAAVRAGNILRKGGAEGEAARQPTETAPSAACEPFLAAVEIWELVSLAARLEAAVEQAIITSEPAYVAKYAFQLAQAFNNFYHRTPVLAETDAERRGLLLRLVAIVRRRLELALDLLGIAVPEAM